ncbi:hypothetical protein ONS95_006417 [Cadophora gregata]|uniref:uncharacterized protein n=1 Tax=Cadophora gregata TaxID=51156 RepID=UPI0026DD4A0A|nr:uncharacterized protein ONS95_006417 [Cadophora gregata]KAK0101238.1 hypothetical protein ONS95_006417 [Cadophora gregata]KAK0106749.1 hypothetical protein ONS96_004367 [Cadophora gregata f. sp. sojae]
MVQMYTIAGRQFGSHVLAMITLGALFGGTALSMGGSTAKKTQGPPINASSPDEESFIKDFLKNAEADEKKDTKKAGAH